MAEETILELIQKLQKAFEDRSGQHKFSAVKEMGTAWEARSLEQLINIQDLQEAYHNKSLQNLQEIENLNGKAVNNLIKIATEIIDLNDSRVSQANILKNLQVHLSNIDMNIQASNAKFGKLLEIIECTSAYKEFEKAKELQKEAESNAREAEKCRQAALTIRIDDHKLFPLRKKAYMCLLRHNIKYIGDLLKYTEKGLWRLEGMGPIGIKEIKEQLAQHNFRLMTQ